MSAHHVVVVGAGFGGLETVHRLAGAPVEITLVDRRNHHLFQPLLYQAATASLAPSEIAWPIRHLFRRRSDVTTLLASVESIDRQARELRLDDGSTLRYDTLVLATGARHAYFGHDAWEPFAPGLKTLEDATTIRGRILLAFEKAERQSDEQKRKALLTFVIVGGGPTGVELAGTIAELARATLPTEFRRIDTRQARILLIEAGPRVLPAFAEDLSNYAKDSLEQLGVEVVLGQPVSECNADGVVFGGQTSGRGDDPLGRGRPVVARRAMARRASRPGWAAQGRTRSYSPWTCRNFRHRRRRDRPAPGRAAGSRHCAGRQAGGRLCRQGHPRPAQPRARAAAVPV